MFFCHGDTYFVTSDTFSMAAVRGGGVDSTVHPSDNDSQWWNLGCLRKCHGTFKQEFYTTQRCEACDRDFHCVCLDRMGWALDGEDCVIDGAWHCKPCAAQYHLGYKDAKEDSALEQNLLVPPQKKFVCQQCKKDTHEHVCDNPTCKRRGKPVESAYHLNVHKQSCLGEYNHFCRVPGCERTKGFTTKKRRDAHENTCRQRMANRQFSTAMQGLLPEGADMTAALGLEEVPAIATASDTAAPAAV